MSVRQRLADLSHLIAVMRHRLCAIRGNCRLTLKSIPTVLACLLCSTASGTGSDWLATGFGTIGFVRPADSDVSLLRNGINTPGRSGVDFGADSILGLQTSRSFASGATVTAQVVIREDQTGHVEPRVAWAFVRLKPIANVDLRLGRLRAPFFMYSESLWINFSNPWIRPPTEVYGLNPFSDLDGADLAWQARVGGSDIELRSFIGTSSLERQIKRARLKRILGANLAVFRDNLVIRISHAESPFSLPWGDPLFLAVDAALRSSPFAATAAQLSGEDGYARFDSIGVQWDSGDYMLSAEYARRAVNRYVPSAHGWQLTLGRRFEAFTLYGTLARQSQDSPVSDADLSDSPPLQEALGLFNASRNTAQTSQTVGVRWDFHRNAALKLEFSRARIADDSLGSFFPVDGSGQVLLSGRRLNLISASLDFSF